MNNALQNCCVPRLEGRKTSILCLILRLANKSIYLLLVCFHWPPLLFFGLLHVQARRHLSGWHPLLLRRLLLVSFLLSVRTIKTDSPFGWSIWTKSPFAASNCSQTPRCSFGDARAAAWLEVVVEQVLALSAYCHHLTPYSPQIFAPKFGTHPIPDIHPQIPVLF